MIALTNSKSRHFVLDSSDSLRGASVGDGGNGASDDRFTNLLAQTQEAATSEDQEKRRQDRSAIHAPASAPASAPLAGLDVPLGQGRLGSEGVQKLVHVLWSAVFKGEQTARVQLNPSELGTLQLNIVLVDNAVFVEARADDPRVLAMIRASKQELAQGLASRGLALSGFTTREDLASRRGEAPRSVAPPAVEQPEQTTSRRNIAALRRSFIEVVI